MTTFDDFWRAYPRKISKRDALKAWTAINPNAALVKKILAAIAWQREAPQWVEDRGRYIPHPASWLRGWRWLDEPDAPKQMLFDCIHTPPCYTAGACVAKRKAAGEA
jgi:hypothetical protein